MSPLRQRMIEDMRLRNLAPLPQDAYIRAVVGLSEYFQKKPPQSLGPEAVRQYLVHLVQEQHLSWGRYNQIRCGLKFFFGVTLGRPSEFRVPFPRQAKKLPSVLSQEQVRRFSSFTEPPAAHPVRRARCFMSEVAVDAKYGFIRGRRCQSTCSMAAVERLYSWSRTARLHCRSSRYRSGRRSSRGRT